VLCDGQPDLLTDGQDRLLAWAWAAGRHGGRYLALQSTAYCYTNAQGDLADRADLPACYWLESSVLPNPNMRWA
jgi:hypothetical protein